MESWDWMFAMLLDVVVREERRVSRRKVRSESWESRRGEEEEEEEEVRGLELGDWGGGWLSCCCGAGCCCCRRGSSRVKEGVVERANLEISKLSGLSEEAAVMPK